MGVLSISGLAKIVGMNVHTIRAWERRYGALNPERTPSGQRTYDMGDVEKLKKLKHLSEIGLPISQIAALSTRELLLLEQDRSIASVEIEKKERISEFQAKPEEIESLTADIISYLTNYDVEKIVMSLSKYRKHMNAKDFVLKVVSPLFQQVGRLVLELKLDIAQEHILSAIIRNQISYLISPNYAEGAPSIAFTTPEGDMHEFGIMLAHVLASCNNLKGYYLGPNLPYYSLSSVSENLKFDHLVLGCTSQNLGYERHSFEEYIKAYIDNTKTHCPKIWIGGKAAALINVDQFQGKVQYVPNLHVLDEYMKEMVNDDK